LRRELLKLGGRTAYQEASELTTTRHRTSKWVFAIITQLGLRPSTNRHPLSLLEIGAVNTQLLSIPWLQVRAIDIQARHPRIEQTDFFDLKPASCYDVVVSSMVLNCLPSPSQRGQMLQLIREHLKIGGHAFIMIPRRCLECSPLFNFEIFSEILLALQLKAR